MKVREALTQTQDQLGRKTGTEARLEAELLLRHHLGADRTRFYLSFDSELMAEDTAPLNVLVSRRLRGEPLAYILGHKEFYGLDLLVGPGVLIPRPETELLVERALSFIKARFGFLTQPVTVADVGTGSGAVAVALATHLPHATIIATDVSARCLAMARQNAQRHQVYERIHLVQGDLLHPLGVSFDLIVGNLPYIRDNEWPHLADEIRLYEPPKALLGGADGLALIRGLLPQAAERLNPKGALLLEIGADQGPALQTLAGQLFPQAMVTVSQDWAGLDRVVGIET